VDTTVGVDMDRLSLAVPSTGTVRVELTNIDTLEPLALVKGGTTATDEPTVVEGASLIMKRVRNDRPMRHPSILQTFPYVNPVTKVYKLRKHVRSLVHLQYEEPIIA